MGLKLTEDLKMKRTTKDTLPTFTSYRHRIMQQVVKVVSQKSCITASNGWFNPVCQVAPICTPSKNAYVDLPESISLMASWLVQPFLHSSQQQVLHFIMGHPFPCIQNCPFAWGIWPGRHLIHVSLDSPKSTTRSRLVRPFLQGSQSWQTDWPTDRPRPRYSVCIN